MSLNGYQLLINFISLTEIDINKQSVKNINFASLNFILKPLIASENPTHVFEYYYNTTNITVYLVLYEKQANIPYGNLIMGVNENTIKFSLYISGWEFSDIANSLAVSFQIDSVDSPILNINSSTYNKFDRYVFHTEPYDIKLSVPTYAIIDGIVQNIVDQLQDRTINSQVSLTLIMPGFKNGLVYDPDIAIIPTSLAPGNNSLSETDSQNLTYILVGVGGLVGVIIIIVIIIAIKTLIRRNKKEEAWKGVTF